MAHDVLDHARHAHPSPSEDADDTIKTVSHIGTDEDWLAVVNPWNYAGFGSLAADRWGIRSIWFSCAFLFISFIIMFIRLEIEEEKEEELEKAVENEFK